MKRTSEGLPWTRWPSSPLPHLLPFPPVSRPAQLPLHPWPRPPLPPARWPAPLASHKAPPIGGPSHEVTAHGRQGAEPGRLRRPWAESGARAILLYVRLRGAAAGQSGRRRQDGVAGDAGDRERGCARATRAHQRARGGIPGAGAGGEPELPFPASPQ